MSTIVVSHGHGASDDSVWFPYLKAALEVQGHHVDIPAYPTAQLRGWSHGEQHWPIVSRRFRPRTPSWSDTASVR